MFNKADIEKYFSAEKTFSGIFMIVAAAAIVLAIVLFFAGKSNAYKGAAVVIVVLSIIQLAASYTVYKRSDGDRKRLTYAYDMNPPLLKNTELPRMEKVEKTFTILLIGEVVLLLAGIGLFLYFKDNEQLAFWKGLGLALAIEAAVMLGADMYAKSNAGTYIKGLKLYAEAPASAV